MLRTSSCALLLLGLHLIAAPLQGQVSYVTGPDPHLTQEMIQQLLGDMRASLHKLVTAQEAYFAAHTRYGKLLSRTDSTLVAIEPEPGVTLTLTYATASSWTGRATHAWLSGMSCVISVGNVPPSKVLQTRSQGLKPTEEGEAICDSPGP